MKIINIQRHLCLLFSALLLCTAFSVSTMAKNKCVPKIYAFGFAASFNDSTVYFTQIHEVDSVWINEKNKFLLNRGDYSLQLKSYFDAKGMPHRTCIISYELKRKDLEKRYEKMKAKYLKKGNYKIEYIDPKDFRFEAVEYTED